MVLGVGTVVTVQIVTAGKGFGMMSPALVGLIAAETVSDPETGEIVLSAGDPVSEAHLEKFKEFGVESLKVVDDAASTDATGVILNTLRKDPDKSQDEALVRIYTLMRPGEPPSMDMAYSLLERLFFNEKRYDLGAVGRGVADQDMKTSGRILLEFLRDLADDIVAVFLRGSERRRRAAAQAVKCEAVDHLRRVMQVQTQGRQIMIHG